LERYLQDEGEGSKIAPICPYPVPKDLQFFNYDTVRQHIREQYFDVPTTNDINRQKIEDLKQGNGRRWHSYRQAQEEPKNEEQLSETDHEFWDQINGRGEIESDARVVKKSAVTKPRTFSLKPLGKVVKSLDDDDENLDQATREALRIRSMRRKKGVLKRNPTTPSAVDTTHSLEDSENKSN